MSSTRTAASNTALALSIDDQERMLREQKLFRPLTLHEGPWQIYVAKQEPIHSLDQAIESFTDEGPPQLPNSRSQLTPAASNLEPESKQCFS